MLGHTVTQKYLISYSIIQMVNDGNVKAKNNELRVKSLLNHIWCNHSNMSAGVVAHHFVYYLSPSLCGERFDKMKSHVA